VKVCHTGESRFLGHSIHEKFNKDSPEIDKWYSGDRRQWITNFVRSGEAMGTVHTDCVMPKILLPVKTKLFIEEERC